MLWFGEKFQNPFMCSLSYTDHCSTGQGPAMKIQVPLSYTHMCTSSAWRQTSLVLTLCTRHQWSGAGGPRWFPGAPGDRSFQELWQNSLKYQNCTASSGLLLIESGHELVMGVFGLPASHLSLPLLSPAHIHLDLQTPGSFIPLAPPSI